jgi:hypothetical protein
MIELAFGEEESGAHPDGDEGEHDVPVRRRCLGGHGGHTETDRETGMPDFERNCGVYRLASRPASGTLTTMASATGTPGPGGRHLSADVASSLY